MLEKHAEKPFHCMVGGGDQVRFSLSNSSQDASQIGNCRTLADPFSSVQLSRSTAIGEHQKKPFSRPFPPCCRADHSRLSRESVSPSNRSCKVRLSPPSVPFPSSCIPAADRTDFLLLPSDWVKAGSVDAKLETPLTDEISFAVDRFAASSFPFFLPSLPPAPLTDHHILALGNLDTTSLTTARSSDLERSVSPTRRFRWCE